MASPADNGTTSAALFIPEVVVQLDVCPPPLTDKKAENGGLVVKKIMTNLPKRPPALIEYSDLVYTVREKSGKWFGSGSNSKQILHSVSGALRPGECKFCTPSRAP